MSKCTCGRTFRPPFCDSSHWLSQEEYNILKEKVNKIYENKNVQTTIQPTNENGLPQSQNVSRPSGSSNDPTF